MPADHGIKLKECEKRDKYFDLARELKKLRNMKVIIILIVIGAFDTVTEGLLKGLEDLEVGGRVDTIQTTALLKTARILRKFLETGGDLLPLNLPMKDHQLKLMSKTLMSKYYIYTYIYIYIIIIMSCRQHGYPWPSLATFPYRSSPPAGLLDYILYPHIAVVCKFGLVVLLLLGHMWGSIGVRHLRARPCFSSSVRRVWLVWRV